MRTPTTKQPPGSRRRQMASIRHSAVQRVLHGEPASLVMKELGLDRSTIYRWLQRYRNEGEAGLQAKTIQGRSPKLSTEHRRQLRRMISDHTPTDMGFNGGLWTPDLLAAIITQTFSVSLGRTALNHLLTNWGLSNERLQNQLPFKQPSYKQQYEQIIQQAKAAKTTVYFLKITRSASQVNAISVTPPGGKLRFMLYRRRPSATQLCEFLAALSTQHTRLLLIADSSPETQQLIDRRDIRKFLNENSQTIHLKTLQSGSVQSGSVQPGSAPTTADNTSGQETDGLGDGLWPQAPALSDIEAWTLLINQSLLDFQFPFGRFLMALNNYFGGSAIILPNLSVPSSPLRPVFSDANLNQMIMLNESTLELWHANPLIKALEKPGDLLSINDVIEKDEWQRNEFCREHLKRAGGKPFDIEALCFAGPENTLCALSLFRTPQSTGLTKEEDRFLRRLQPHLETAMALTVAYMRNIYTLTALEEATDHLDIATLVLDGNRQIIKSNGAAQELLNQKGFVEQIHQRLTFRHSESQEKFEKAVAKSIRWRQIPIGNKPVEAFQFKDTASQFRNTEGRLSNTHEKTGKESHIGVLVQPITPPSFAIPHSTVVSPHVVVYISNPEKPRETPQRHLIMELFNLSRREAHLTTLITEGQSLQEAATAMNITQATARTYLQHIYEKTGVKRRQDLVQRVLKSVALLA